MVDKRSTQAAARGARGAVGQREALGEDDPRDDDEPGPSWVKSYVGGHKHRQYADERLLKALTAPATASSGSRSAR